MWDSAAVEHLATLLATEDGDDDGDSIGDDDPLEDVDRVLLHRLGSPWDGPYDLVGGLVGVGVYFLGRLPRPAAVQGVQAVVQHLHETCVESWGGTTWHTSPRHVPEWQLELCPSGYCNLGVAHGVPGVIAFLSEVAARGIEAPAARRLVEGAVGWVLARERPPEALSRFGPWFVPGADSEDTRVSWCYGDLGVASTLDFAGRRLGRDDWRERADRLFVRCIQRLDAMEPVPDAGLCHGAMGIAHLFNRAWQYRGDERYRAAAQEWIGRGLAMRCPGKGVYGFSALVFKPQHQVEADRSFLEGAIGAALMLLAASSTVEPQWDRMLLIS